MLTQLHVIVSYPPGYTNRHDPTTIRFKMCAHSQEWARFLATTRLICLMTGRTMIKYHQRLRRVQGQYYTPRRTP